MPRLLLACLAGLMLAAPLRAQVVSDTFADGDFTADPPWTGETAFWTVEPLDDDFVLRSAGPAASDTLHLATASDVAFGSWQLTVGHEGLSNFNKVRVYLVSDRADLEGAVDGFFVELGTNARDVTLYRSEAGERAERAASAEDVLSNEPETVALAVTRTPENVWTVALDGAELFTYDGGPPTVTTSSYVGVWVKHSSARGGAFYFDDVLVTGEASIPDEVPPAVEGITYADGLPGFIATFTEDIDFTTVEATDFSVEGVGAPVGVVPGSGRDTTRSVALQLASPLASGTYAVTAGGLADLAGNALRDTTVSVMVVTDETPPALAAVEALAEDTVRVAFDEPVTAETACTTAAYTLSGDIGPPAEVVCPAVTPEQGVVTDATLVLAQTLVTGGTYTLTARGLADLRGNVREEDTATFVYVAAGAVPAPGDVAINEFNYSAFGSDLEYVEVLNLSDETFDLRDFELGDATRDFVPLAEAPRFLLPGDYAVAVRDSAAFAARFAETDFAEASDWPALNNGGDEIVLRYAAGDVPLTVDSLRYTSAWGGSDAALERIDPLAPSGLALNWAPSTDPLGGTPGAENSVFAPDTTPPALRSAAPTAAGDTLRAVFSEPLDPGTVDASDFAVAGEGAPAVAAVELREATAVLALAEPLARGDYTLAVTDVADFRGNTLDRAEVAFTFFRGDAAAPGDVVVNEINYGAFGSDLEYVEILNASEKTFDLAEFALADATSEPVALAEEARRLAPGDYAVFVRDADAFSTRFPEAPHRALDDWPNLNNGGDTATLLYGGEVVDAVPYEPSWGGSDAALERLDPDGPSAASVNWASSTDPLGGTPGARNSVFARDTDAPQLLFVEQIADTVFLATFSEPLDPASVQASDFAAAAQTTSAVRVELIGDGATVRVVFASEPAAGTFTVEGVADLTGNVLDRGEAVVAVQPAPGEVAINEILFAPSSDSVAGRPPAPEYVELLNRTGRLLSLRGLLLTSSAGSDTFAVAPGPTALPPEGFAVIFADPDPEGDPATASTLARAFPEIDYRSEGAATLLAVDRSSLDLSNSGETVRVHRADTTVLDAVPYEPAWHSPDLEETRGVALERVDAGGDPAAPDNWSSAVVPAGGTPGRPNSIAVDPAAPPASAGLRVAPSPFSPDNDGFDDFTTIAYTLDAAPATLRVRIFNQTGRLVRTLTPATLGGPTGSLTWDGRDDEGRRVRMGIYVVVLDAVAAEAGRTEAHREPVVVARRL